MQQGEIEDSNITTRGLLVWVSCIGDFAGGGAGIGSAVGLFGGPEGVATGAAIGGALGGSFGLGFCTAAEIDKALR